MLFEIAKNLVSAETVADSYSAVQAYKTFLQDYTQFDIDSDTSRSDYKLDSGYAIGTGWAARCIDDFLRTQSFIKGLYQAIQNRLLQTQGPVQVFYAGTGPFATLALPQLALFSEEEVRFTFLEINAVSKTHCEKLIQQLGFENKIAAFFCEDACKFQIPEENQPHILLTETMQAALLREQQVPISLNLLSQVREDCLLIPQSIRLKIGLFKFLSLDHESDKNYHFHDLGTFFTLDKQAISTPPHLPHENKDIYHFPSYQVLWPNKELSPYDSLVVFTEIDIFDKQTLRAFDAGLTMPHKLADLSGLDQLATHIQVQYLIDQIPMIKFKLLSD